MQTPHASYKASRGLTVGLKYPVALRKHPDARFVLLILRSHVGPPIFKLITDDTSFNVGEFQFIASETWGTRDEYQHPKLVGAITVAQEMPQSSEYESWIHTQVPKATSPKVDQHVTAESAAQIEHQGVFAKLIKSCHILYFLLLLYFELYI
jgi:hypothetical protein